MNAKVPGPTLAKDPRMMNKPWDLREWTMFVRAGIAAEARTQDLRGEAGLQPSAFSLQRFFSPMSSRTR
jgi:hypothetical protein